MASIPKVFHTLEKKEMTVSEYEEYLRNHHYWTSIKAIRCIECGDLIVYCNGSLNKSYFKHSPTHAGHGYCSLYHEGKESKTCEALIRKKLFKEEDITLNFELKYQSGNWKSLITIPPFNQSDLENNTRNNTKIIIGNSFSNRTEILIDKDHMSAGEIRRVGLQGFPYDLRISITGNSATKNILYTMMGFDPNSQIYSSLILQNYVVENNYDLRKIKTFVCKKMGGHIYTGRHYLIFSRAANGFYVESEAKKNMQITRLELINDRNFNYSVYDVVFLEATDATKSFCNKRGCELVEKTDAIILWPPVNSIGNYKYYKNGDTKMFVAFENESNTLDLYGHDTSYLYFKVQNINTNPFFVMKYTKKIKEKTDALFENNELLEIDLDNNHDNYLFDRDVLIRQVSDMHLKLKKNQSLLMLKSPLERIRYSVNEENNELDVYKLKNAIWYSKEYARFKDIEYKFLIDKYKDNDFIIQYIEMCRRNCKIKKEALKLLMEV